MPLCVVADISASGSCRQAFTRLLGPVIDILQRKAGSYGAPGSASGGQQQGQGQGTSGSHDNRARDPFGSQQQQPGLVTGEA